MDLVSELRRKVAEIDHHQRCDGIKAAIRHIEVAERYLARGRQDQDPDSFNDVIYRTNQAFEGMLKEAYAVLEDADAKRLSPNEIEEYLLTKKRLTERVLGLFKNYRQQWRNPATHDHTLLFSEQEAMLGIVSVSAFAVVLLDQIVETISFKRQRLATSQRRDSWAAELRTVQARTLGQRVAAFLESFVRHRAASSETFRSEAELIGALSGFLVGLGADLQVVPDARLGNRLRPDLLVSKNNEVVVVEVKHGRPRRHYTEAAIAQLKEYVAVANADAGILFLWPSQSYSDGRATKLVLEDSDSELWVIGGALNEQS